MPSLSIKIPENKEAGEDLEQKFYRLAEEWREETASVSSMTKLVMNQNYQSIIGMGSAAIPLLLKELQDRPDHWFWALNAITEDPTKAEDAGDLHKMTAAWLNWAAQNHPKLNPQG